MTHTAKRLFAGFLVMMLVLGTLVCYSPSASAQTGTLIANTGTRHETCTSLSTQAQAYYTGEYTWETLSGLTGGTSSCLETDNDLYQALHALMESTMTGSVTYTNLKQNYVYTDVSGGSEGYVLFYSDAYSTDVSNSLIAREHVWPKSHASFYELGGGADLHHLRPTYQYVNAARSNNVFANVQENYPSTYTTYSYNDTVVLYKATADGTEYVEVNDNIKGDVARILLYVWCRWEEPNLFEDIDDPQVNAEDNSAKNTNDGSRVIDNLETLLQWCLEDPVDTWEMSRNDQVENVQGNRNVFIDYPELAWLVFGLEVPEDLTSPSQSGTYTNSTGSSSTGSGNTGDADSIVIIGDLSIPTEGLPPELVSILQTVPPMVILIVLVALMAVIIAIAVSSGKKRKLKKLKKLKNVAKKKSSNTKK